MEGQGTEENVVAAVMERLARDPSLRPRGADAWLAQVRGSVTSSLATQVIDRPSTRLASAPTEAGVAHP